MPGMKENILNFLRYSLPTRALAAAARRRRSAASVPHILVTRIDGIGDFILLAPFLRELRTRYRDSQITLVVGRNGAPLARRCPYVNTVLEVDLAPKRGGFSNYAQYAA